MDEWLTGTGALVFFALSAVRIVVSLVGFYHPKMYRGISWDMDPLFSVSSGLYPLMRYIDDYEVKKHKCWLLDNYFASLLCLKYKILCGLKLMFGVR
jgi:hypothetical protein